MIFSKISKFRSGLEIKREYQATLAEINDAKKEVARLCGIFNLSASGLQSDRLIFQIKAAEIKYRYLCNLAKEKPIFFPISSSNNISF